MKLLAIDVGNSRAHAALFQNGRRLRLIEGPPWPKADIIAAATVRPSYSLPKGTKILTRDFPPLVRNRTRKPDTVGPDRLAAASAAYADAKRSCVAVTIGTAITVSVVNGKGDFVGGLISPGLRLQAGVLHEETELLPQVEPRRAKSVVGKSTPAAIEAGISFAVEGLLREVRREVGKVPIYGSGGDGILFRDLFDHWRPHLVLEGIDCSYRHA